MPAAPRTDAAPAAPAAHPGPAWAGVLLTRVPVVLAAAVAAVTAVAVPLVLLDLWAPWTAVPVCLVAAALAGRLAWAVPVVPAPAWAALLSAAVAVGGGLWAALTRAEHVVLRRDAGSQALYAHHLATHHGLPVDPSLAALGGAEALADPNVTIASPAFYEVGTDVVPQFLLGAPALYSLGEWAAGWEGLLLAPAVVAVAALLAVAGLAARVVGPRWAPPAVAVFALAQPVLHVNRSTYSEVPALLVLAAAASVLVAATAATATPTLAARLGGGAGLLLGACGFVRIDYLREVALLLPVVAVLAALRHPAARALPAGAAVTTVLAAAAAVTYSRPYLGTISGSLLPLVAALAALGAASWLGVRLARSGRLARVRWLTSPRLAPALCAVLALVLVGLASRPLWLVVRQDPADPGSRLVAGLQQAQGLPVDGGRTYAEHSVDWLSWYLGWPAVLAAGAAAVVLLARLVPALQGRTPLPAWSAPFAVAVGSTLLTLYRPGITPDHPWADRRFVPVVLPAVVLLATAALAWAVRVLAARTARWGTGAAVVGALLLLVPTALATAPLAGQRTERGQLAAVAEACASFEDGDVALAVDPRSRNEWPQVLRGTCGVPTASIVVPTSQGRPGTQEYLDVLRSAVQRQAGRVREAGGRPVLVAAGGDLAAADTLRALGVTEPTTVTRVRTSEDERVLTERPDGGQAITVELVTGVAPEPAGGAAA
ncbi:hypothetical protein MO973_30660 [Paenibacillus sp. TRM 82003]|uniref:hypothetical protein n=1 Tax=Kineococcus sp. TRM81007 TaxID=2925831 RepID=UPI001F58A572|nr:hypothetical protein [Kineococcus sp. TRM81007]MCI2237853.1 hypothetical protein [Kineococcus sp. TRM81007]MCI3924584.1 hypothetical protein [Paenibacillus sp. TRM 82003]